MKKSKVEKTQKISAVDIVDRLIGEAVRSRASDVHFESRADGICVRARRDGELYEMEKIDGDDAARVIARLKVISGMDVTERRLPQDGSADFDGARLRVSTLPTCRGENATVRILDGVGGADSFAEYGIDAECERVLARLMEARGGIVLIAGPTGSGKSTTMYAILKRLRQAGASVVTLEDPVEYYIDGVSQVAADGRGGLTFRRAVRAVYRHDPDVIAVGELRDSDAALAAFDAASAGMLVFATIHAPCASATPARLYRLGISSGQLADTLRGVVVERLIKKPDGGRTGAFGAAENGGDVALCLVAADDMLAARLSEAGYET